MRFVNKQAWACQITGLLKTAKKNIFNKNSGKYEKSEKLRYREPAVRTFAEVYKIIKMFLCEYFTVIITRYYIIILLIFLHDERKTEGYHIY